MLLHKMLEQFENISGAEKLGPVSSMMLISLWRKAEKMSNQSVFSISGPELMVLSGIKKVSSFQQALNRLVSFGFIRYECDKDNRLQIELNLNLYSPFENNENQKHKYTNVMDALEKTYLQLRGAGMFISPLEFNEIRKIANTGIDVEDAVKLLEECFEQYTPKYKDDSIRSFKYCANYILSRYSQEQVKKGAYQNGKYEKITSGFRKGKPETPREIRAYKEKLRARGILKGIVGDVNYDF